MHDGYLSSNGTCFDIGNTVRAALDAYLETLKPYAGSTNPASAGNGSIMRLAPIAVYYRASSDDVEHWSAESSRTTHGAPECLAACRILGRMLFAALQGSSKSAVLTAASELTDLPGHALRGIAHGDYVSKTVADTTAAVCGQVAGAFYGRAGIPEAWLRKLVMREEIEKLAERLHYRA